MSRYSDTDRQLALAMMMLHELAPGCVCLDTACPTGEPVPHMANDIGNHPRPYGERPPWSAQTIGRIRKAKESIMRALIL